MHIISIIGFTLDVVGKIIIAYTAMRVHYRFRKEHKVDERVFRAMRREHFLGIVGIALVVAGYFMQLPTKIGG